MEHFTFLLQPDYQRCDDGGDRNRSRAHIVGKAVCELPMYEVFVFNIANLIHLETFNGRISVTFACPNILVKGRQNVVVDFIVFDNEKFMTLLSQKLWRLFSEQYLLDIGHRVLATGRTLLQALDSFIVVEREGLIIACAALFHYLGKKWGEVAAIAVSPECRGQGQGDKLLDYIENKESSIGFEMLFLVTTQQTADCIAAFDLSLKYCSIDEKSLLRFVRRGFSACSVECIPEEKRKKINRSHG
ncbi:hypothetical protein RHSIM_RhsimUnG0137900 [Rhododendron simsii]|uniref:N-acetyltransferase domain-containing protein n=1 Tax=Rhododendron simsii TaxID=118357 RepID=A0A834FY04_RHOSS|nr:hypothetical protein RHSIM_RhsimUnG0137900 [Rhododendron simsii]